jgi:MFS superfamily sulfate permease-like transporter
MKAFFWEHPFRTGGIAWLVVLLIGVIVGIAPWIESKAKPCLLMEDCIDFTGVWFVASTFWGLVGGFIFGMVVAIIFAVKKQNRDESFD